MEAYEEILITPQVSTPFSIGNKIYVFEDKSNQLEIDQIKLLADSSFIKSTVNTPNLGLSQSTFWIRFSVNNEYDINSLLLEIKHATLDNVELYS